ncbi:MAG: dockerin type I domain-containing protein, partial [Acutalibacteraceae bacterium]
GDGYLDPITKQRYRWTADGLSCSYFEDGKLYRQAFRFGMMEARIYTVNGVARVDENGDPVYDADGKIQQDPATAQGLWNGFWTCGNADMSKKSSSIDFHESYFGWPYNGEIDICEAYNTSSLFNNYDYSTNETLHDENGLIYKFDGGTYFIKHDSHGKTLITNAIKAVLVSYDYDAKSYVVSDKVKSKFKVLTDDDGSQYIQMYYNNNYYYIKQQKNSSGVISNYVCEPNMHTIVDADGNCYGSATLSTAQFHYDKGTRLNADGTYERVAGTYDTGHNQSLGGGYRPSTGNAGETMTGDTGYHTYGIYWTPTQMVFYVDNCITGICDITSPEYFALRECPQYPMLTFPIGGSMPGGPNPALTSSEYLVDYVRIYQADDSAYGNTNSPEYRGTKGFPTLNERGMGYDSENECVDMSYYQPIIDAYSHINVIGLGEGKNAAISGDKCTRRGWNNPPFTSSKNCVFVQDEGQITTKMSFSEGKYDVYIQGLCRYYGMDFAASLNDTDIGSQLKLYSDRPIDEYGRTYAGAADAYLGTAEIKNGSHNLKIKLKRSLMPDGLTENEKINTIVNGGAVYALIAVANSKNTTTVTIDEDSDLNPSTVPTTATPTEPTTIPDNFYDAYTAELSGGAHQAKDHTGYYGGGFVDQFGPGKIGSAITFDVNAQTAGTYLLRFRYANSCGDGNDARPTLYIDDVKIKDLTFAENGLSSLPNYTGWNYWSENDECSAYLTSGSHKIKLIYEFGPNNYACNVDGLTLVQISSGTSVTASETIVNPITYGDLDSNGKINLLDLIAMRKHLAKWSITVDLSAADCNADGNVNLLDLILLRKYLAKWNVVLGPHK